MLLPDDYVSPLRALAAEAGLTPQFARTLLGMVSSRAIRDGEKNCLRLAGLPDSAHPIQLLDFVVNDWRAGLLRTLSSEPDTPIAFTPTVAIATVLAAQLYVYTADNSCILVPDTRLDELKAISRDPHLIFGIDDYRFEELTAFLYELLGFITATTKKSGDSGVDVLVWHPAAIKESPLRAIQAKRWAPEKGVGIAEVQRMKGVLIDFNATSAEIVTTSYFTKEARRSADRGHVTISLTDFTELQSRVEHALKQ